MSDTQPNSNSMHTLADYLNTTEEKLEQTNNKMKSFLKSYCKKLLDTPKQEQFQFGLAIEVRINHRDLFKEIKDHFTDEECDIILMWLFSKNIHDVIQESGSSLGSIIDKSQLKKLKEVKSFDELLSVIKDLNKD